MKILLLSNFQFSGSILFTQVSHSNQKPSIRLLSLLVYGRCLFVEDLGYLEDYQFIKLDLNPERKFIVFLHDPNFFFFSLNPESAPLIKLYLNMSELKTSRETRNVAQQWINAVKNIKYNRKQSPCVDDVDYSFTSCLIDHIVQSTNCTVYVNFTQSFLIFTIFCISVSESIEGI